MGDLTQAQLEAESARLNALGEAEKEQIYQDSQNATGEVTAEELQNPSAGSLKVAEVLQTAVAQGEVASDIPSLINHMQGQSANLRSQAGDVKAGAADLRDAPVNRDVVVGAVLTQILPIIAGAAIGGSDGALVGLEAGAKGGAKTMDTLVKQRQDDYDNQIKQSESLTKQAAGLEKEARNAMIKGEEFESNRAAKIEDRDQVYNRAKEDAIQARKDKVSNKITEEAKDRAKEASINADNARVRFAEIEGAYLEGVKNGSIKPDEGQLEAWIELTSDTLFNRDSQRYKMYTKQVKEVVEGTNLGKVTDRDLGFLLMTQKAQKSDTPRQIYENMQREVEIVNRIEKRNWQLHLDGLLKKDSLTPEEQIYRKYAEDKIVELNGLQNDEVKFNIVLVDPQGNESKTQLNSKDLEKIDLDLETNPKYKGYDYRIVR